MYILFNINNSPAKIIIFRGVMRLLCYEFAIGVCEKPYFQ